MRPPLPSPRGALARSIAFVLAAVLGGGVLSGCGSFAGPTEKGITFATMQALNPGVDGEWVLRENPDVREVARDPRTGRLRRLAYWVRDPGGDNRPLVLHFDAQGILERKEYGGPLLRPPVEDPPPERAP